MTITQRRTEAADSELLVAGELGTIHHSCLPETQRLSRGRESFIVHEASVGPHLEVVGMRKLVVRNLEVS